MTLADGLLSVSAKRDTGLSSQPCCLSGGGRNGSRRHLGREGSRTLRDRRRYRSGRDRPRRRPDQHDQADRRRGRDRRQGLRRRQVPLGQDRDLGPRAGRRRPFPLRTLLRKVNIVARARSITTTGAKSEMREQPAARIAADRGKILFVRGPRLLGQRVERLGEASERKRDRQGVSAGVFERQLSGRAASATEAAALARRPRRLWNLSGGRPPKSGDARRAALHRRPQPRPDEEGTPPPGLRSWPRSNGS
jgi:hypothetical protein